MKYIKRLATLTIVVVCCSACVSYKVKTSPYKNYYFQSSDTVYLAGLASKNPDFERHGTAILDNILGNYRNPRTITTIEFGTLLFANAVGNVPDVIDSSFLATLNDRHVHGFVLKCRLIDSDEEKRMIYIQPSQIDRFNPNSYRKDPSSLFIFDFYDIANRKLAFTCIVQIKKHSLVVGHSSGYDTNLNPHVNESFPSSKFRKAIKKVITECDLK